MESIGWVGNEHFLDLLVEDFAEFECEGQARGVFASFERDDRLPGDADAIRQFRLGPVELGAKNFKPVFHW